MLFSPPGPMQQVFKAVPSAPQHSGKQVAKFGYAEAHLRFGSFFLHALATQIGERQQVGGRLWLRSS